jgi:hypothetical protein
MMPYFEMSTLRDRIAEASELERRYRELRASKSPEAFEVMDDLHNRIMAAYSLEDSVFRQIERMLSEGF